MNFLQTLATAEATEAQGDIMSALGIDWRLLVLQVIAFLILVWLLGKFVYPWLMKSVDKRQADIEAAADAAEQAKESANETEEKSAKLLAKARKEAAEIVSTAKLEATNMLSASEKRAKDTAEKIVADAQVQLKKNVDAAKRDLHNETISLVALATEKVVGKVQSKKADEALIADALKGLK